MNENKVFTVDQKELVLSLIKDDLVNQKLINNLRSMGIDAGDYNLCLGSTIFDIMNIDQPVNDRSYDTYMQLVEIASDFSLQDHHKFEEHAIAIYHYLEILPKEEPKQTA